MQDNQEEIFFHHALKVLEDVCIGCTHCMTVCPTQAIRVRKGVAKIIDNRCIDCGECSKACPVNAIIVEQDDFKEIFKFEARVALVPAVLIGQFPEKITSGRIYESLRELGFTHVYEVESTVGLVIEGYKHHKIQNQDRPLISSFCPAVVRLIQVRFPALVDHIIKVKPPIDTSAIYFRNELLKEGFSDESIGIFYVTPCAAKIAAVKSPVGQAKSAVTGVINMKFLYNRILQILQKNGDIEDLSLSNNLLSKEGILWSLTRGETSRAEGRALAVDGVHNINDFLERLENEEIDDIDFLELRACDESCAGGILISGNRFLTVERLNKRASQYKSLSEISSYPKIVNDDIFLLGEILPRPMEKLDKDISKAIKKIERKRRLMCYLPAFDCAACGAPNCDALAGDIVQGKAEVSHCIFMQQNMLKTKTLSIDRAIMITENIWGTDRLKKDCSKLGAEDENS